MADALRVVVGLSGGIAAYKAVGVVREFVLRGHDVHVVATESALRFVGRPTLEAISRNTVETELFDGVAEVRHVALGQSADLVVVAPATANTLAKLAHGLSDDLLGTTVLASTAPLVVAPAMHTEMWMNAATRENIATLERRGVHVVGPASGQLTGSDSGLGRMSEPVEIVDAALAAVGPRDLVGRRIVVTAGGTREPLDPVRFIGNRSSGRQGVALARAAAARGADVVLIAAHLEVPPPAGVTLREAASAEELQEAVRAESATADVVIMAAAVADYRAEHIADAKIKKDTHGDELTVRLIRNPDILAGLASERRPGQVIVGFAAETAAERETLLELGRAKARRKGADYLVVNRVGWHEGFATEGNEVVVLSGGGDIVTETRGSKREVADAILDIIR